MRCTICGISGFIGRSKHPEVSYELITALFRDVEIRGTDAAGFWGTEAGDNGKILYHKEPGKSSEFIKKDVWTQVANYDPNLFLVHARGASMGAGQPWQNKNNHPFVSTDRTIGLVHNGRIPEMEYDALKKKYDVYSDCDSEIILRMFEACEQSDEHAYKEFDKDGMEIAHRLSSLHNIWSQVIKGHMAVAIGERLQGGNRRLWLFRNQFRSLWLIDLRKSLGQIFFCSTPEIWQKASQSCRLFKPFVRKRIKLTQLPAEEVWTISVSDDKPIAENAQILKFEVVSEGFKSVEHTGKSFPILKRPIQVEVYTKLDADDSVNRSSNIGNHSEVKKKLSSRHSQTSSATPSSVTSVTVSTVTDHGTDGTTNSTETTDFKAEIARDLAEIARGASFSKKKQGRSGTSPIFFKESPKTNNAAKSIVNELFENENDNDNGVNNLFKDKDDDDNGYSKWINETEMDDFDMTKACSLISQIKNAAEDIETTVMNLRAEDSLTSTAYNELVANLESILLDLTGSKTILESA